MNKQEFKGNWQQLKGKVQEQWGKLTGDDLMRIDGQYEQLVGVLQERYGKSKEAAEKEVNQYLNQPRH